MKRTVVSLVLICSNWLMQPASAQEFGVFGISLEQFSSEYLEANIVASSRAGTRSELGFSIVRPSMGGSSSLYELSLMHELGFWGQTFENGSRFSFGRLLKEDYKLPDYDLYEGYTAEQANTHNAWVDIASFDSGPNPAQSGHLSLHDLSETKDHDIISKQIQWV